MKKSIALDEMIEKLKKTLFNERSQTKKSLPQNFHPLKLTLLSRLCSRVSSS